MAVATKIDWVAAQKYYLEDGTRSYKDVAEHFGVTETSVERHASKEKWVSRREQVGQESIAKAQENIVDMNAEVNNRHRGMAQALQRLAYEKLTIANRQIDKAKRDAENGKGLDSLTIYDEGMISESKMKFLAETLVLGINLERVTLGMPTTVERKEVTGQNGRDLFGNADKSKILDLVADTIGALDRGTTAGNNAGNLSSGTNSSS